MQVSDEAICAMAAMMEFCSGESSASGWIDWLQPHGLGRWPWVREERLWASIPDRVSQFSWANAVLRALNENGRTKEALNDLVKCTREEQTRRLEKIFKVGDEMVVISRLIGSCAQREGSP